MIIADDSVMDDIPSLLGDKYIVRSLYSVNINPPTIDSIYKGTAYQLTGFQSGNYGFQNVYSYSGVPKFRELYNGIWSNWVDYQTCDRNNSNIIQPVIPINITPSNNKVTNYSGFGNTYYYKTGTRVHIHMGVKVDNGNSPEWISVFTLPTGYRPINTMFVLGTGSSFMSPAGMIVNPTGIVQVSTNSSYCGADIEYDAAS